MANLNIFDIISKAADEILDATSTAKSLLAKTGSAVEDGVFLSRPEFRRNNLIHPQVFQSDADAIRADLSTEAGRIFAAATSYIELTFGGT